MKLRQAEKGNVALEFAIILPVFLLIVGGIIDFGRAYWFKQTLTWASREGARYGSILSKDEWDANLVKDRVINAVLNGCGAALTRENVAVTPETRTSADTELTVKVAMPFSFFLIPYPLENLSGQTTMRFESS